MQFYLLSITYNKTLLILIKPVKLFQIWKTPLGQKWSNSREFGNAQIVHIQLKTILTYSSILSRAMSIIQAIVVIFVWNSAQLEIPFEITKLDFIKTMSKNCIILVLYNQTISDHVLQIKAKMIRTTDDMGSSSWACMDCDYRTSFQTNLFSHIESHHFKDIRYECHFCLSSPPSKNSLRMNIRRRHPDI